MELGYRDEDISDYLENIVYYELLRRGYQVSIGKLGDLEIDFIAEKRKEKLYIQVSDYFLDNEKTKDRELRVFRKIPDDHPKYVISMEKNTGKNSDGIFYVNILDWLG